MSTKLNALLKQVDTAAKEIFGAIEGIDGQIAALHERRQEIGQAPVSRAEFVDYIGQELDHRIGTIKVSMKKELAKIDRSFFAMEKSRLNTQFLTGGDVLPVILSERAAYWYMKPAILERMSADDGKTVSCTEAANAAIWKATLELVIQSVSDTAAEIAAPLYQAGFTAGDQSGYQLAMGRVAKVPAIQSAAPLFDSQALVKSIGEELRKAYEAGLTAGKAPPPSRVASARQTVQRDREGGIAATVVHYQYEEAEGTNPPPL